MSVRKEVVGKRQKYRRINQITDKIVEDLQQLPNDVKVPDVQNGLEPAINVVPELNREMGQACFNDDALSDGSNVGYVCNNAAAISYDPCIRSDDCDGWRSDSDDEPINSFNCDMKFRHDVLYDEPEESLAQKLREWKVKHDISNTALSALLKILKSQSCIEQESLPSDARTLLQTPRELSAETVGRSGQYMHFGLINGVVQKLKSGLRDEFRIIDGKANFTIDVNIDGLPPYNSSK